MSKLLSIDPSLTQSGWALFCLNTARPLATGVIAPPGTELNLSKRYDILQLQVLELLQSLKLKSGNYLICEGPAPLVKNPNSALKVEGVRGIFESVARAQGLSVPGRINPRSVQAEILGMRGKQLERKLVKEWARATAERLFKDEIPNIATLQQDIIDALLIGALGLSRINSALRAKADPATFFVAQQKRGGKGRSSGWTMAEVRHLAIKRN